MVLAMYNTLFCLLCFVSFTDANTSPTIDNFVYRVCEDTPKGELAFKINASDAENDPLTFTLSGPNAAFFNVEKDTGRVFISQQLDRESNDVVRVNLVVSDGPNRTPGELTIIVREANDNKPTFLESSYDATILENTPVGASLFSALATDRDISSGGIVYYSIDEVVPNSGINLFSISTTGEVRLNGSLNYNSLSTFYQLKINATATESKKDIHGVFANTTAQVQINIIDINDNKPEFYKCGDSCVKAAYFTGEVLEHSFGSISINMTVKDLDRAPRTLLIMDGEDKDVFSLEPQVLVSSINVQLVVKQPQKLDYEVKQHMVLQVIAIDEEESTFRSNATVNITIKDINDNSPTFPKDSYKLSVPEHAPNGTVISNFTAEDPDTMDQGKITYRLLPDSILLYFNVDSRTGTVFVRNSTLLDREVRSLHSVTLQARDSENQTGSTELEITVTDINDQYPVINRDSYQVFVKEGAKCAVEIKVKIFLICQKRTTEGLDMKLKGKYLVTVTATDTGGLFTNTELEIFTVDESYKVELEFTSSEQEVEEKLNEIINALTAATKATVKIVAIRSDTAALARQGFCGNTVIVAYFVYGNGSALTSAEVEKMLSHPDHYLILRQLGLKNIGNAPLISTEPDPLQYILLGIVAGLVIVLLVLLTTLLCTRRNYKRKLKAAKAMKSATMVTSDNQKSAAVVPGTNKYTMEGANPVLNLNMDTAIALGLDEETSDVDKDSLSSLDNYEDFSKETDSVKQIIKEEDDEERNGPQVFDEPLGAALALRNKKKDKNHFGLTLNNPAFSTTDL
uniref:Cadherin domain-containing protein n=2 Tax=Tetraodon nigroviridis TaxID=99883 RepID=H3CJ85_TETNG